MNLQSTNDSLVHGGSMEYFGWIVRGYMVFLLFYRKNEVGDYDKFPTI